MHGACLDSRSNLQGIDFRLLHSLTILFSNTYSIEIPKNSQKKNRTFEQLYQQKFSLEISVRSVHEKQNILHYLLKCVATAA